jgi:dipeptidyl aminopeptidase/acylaminoacyl peptidase
MNNIFMGFIILIAAINPVEANLKNTDRWNSFLKSTEQEIVALAPSGEFALFLHQIKYQSIEYLSQPRMPLAGLDFYLQLASRTDTPQYSHATLVNIADSSQIKIFYKEGVIIDFSWSPDTEKIAFLIQNETEIHLWLHNIDTNTSKKLAKVNLSARIGNRHLRWLPNSQAIVVKQRSAFVEKSQVLRREPQIESSELQVSQGKTYQNLLVSEGMKEQFIELAQTKLVMIYLDGKVTALTKNELFDNFSISPDGNYLLSSIIPSIISSYLPYKKWGRTYKVIDLKNPELTHTLPSLNNSINLPKSKDSVAIGARLVKWLPFEKSTVSWVEASDQGDMSSQQTYHDHIYKLESPFKQSKKLLLQAKWRVHDVLWGYSGNGVLQEWRYETRQARTTLISKDSSIVTFIHQRDYRDKYNDFGDPHTRRTPEGFEVLFEQGEMLFFFASGQSEDGMKPYVKSYNTAEKSEKTVFISHNDYVEIPLAIKGNLLIIQQQNSGTPPRYYSLMGKDLKNKTLIFANSSANHFRHEPVALSYKRHDGLELTGTMHLPNNYNPDSKTKLSAVLWIYPDEFKSKKLSQQHTTNTQAFRGFDPLSPLVFLHDGIAVFEAPSMPITSFDGGEPNDDFIYQIRLNAEAAIEALKNTGYIDVQKLAIMGHSYGAFTVSNLLAHTDLFEVGIARSGAYNRTLTPFGFQGEKRNLWQAKDTYIKISPLIYADQINEPLLLIHGEDDQNPGTYPMQSKRMYQALIANNKTVKLIMLPYEGHSYRAKENLNLLLEQQSSWLRKWLNVGD